MGRFDPAGGAGSGSGYMGAFWPRILLRSLGVGHKGDGAVAVLSRPGWDELGYAV